MSPLPLKTAPSLLLSRVRLPRGGPECVSHSGAVPWSGGGGGETSVGQALRSPRPSDPANERVPGRVAEHRRLREMSPAHPGPLPDKLPG